MIAEMPRVDSFRSPRYAKKKKKLCPAGVFSLVFNKGPILLRRAARPPRFNSRDLARGKKPRRFAHRSSDRCADGPQKGRRRAGKPQTRARAESVGGQLNMHVRCVTASLIDSPITRHDYTLN